MDLKLCKSCSCFSVIFFNKCSDRGLAQIRSLYIIAKSTLLHFLCVFNDHLFTCSEWQSKPYAILKISNSPENDVKVNPQLQRAFPQHGWWGALDLSSVYITLSTREDTEYISTKHLSYLNQGLKPHILYRPHLFGHSASRTCFNRTQRDRAVYMLSNSQINKLQMRWYDIHTNSQILEPLSSFC